MYTPPGMVTIHKFVVTQRIRAQNTVNSEERGREVEAREKGRKREGERGDVASIYRHTCIYIITAVRLSGSRKC